MSFPAINPEQANVAYTLSFGLVELFAELESELV
jgi:hypothetical protein